VDLTESSSELLVLERKSPPFKVSTSHRIGVTADLKRKLRFYIRGNPHVSR
jgi:3-methyladenine DNA glycosylase Mpg